MGKEDEQKSGQEQPEGERKFSQEQYDMLLRCSEKKDITEWNEWRKDNPNKKVLLECARLVGANLQDAHLRQANLQSVNLWGAHLRGADLRQANLQDAILKDANLQGAILEKANLQDAHLEGANLQGANLAEANLYKANLARANFYRANLKDADLTGANLQGAHLAEANLQNAILLEWANLQGAYLWGANLRGAYLPGANLQGAILWEANLRGADFGGANLQGAALQEALMQGAVLTSTGLQGADFSRAIVDGGTLIWNCEIDQHTKFEGVGLDNARIYPEQKQLLKYNIRRMNWEEWYRGKSENKWIIKIHQLLTCPVRLFWWVSNYGLSTWRIIFTFFALAFVFAVAYWQWPNFVAFNSNPVLENFQSLWHAFYFSVVTMTTLGFGDIAANPGSWKGQGLLMLQVILGYVLLGALVTRFAVLFTAGGPAGKFSKSKIKETAEDKKQKA